MRAAPLSPVLGHPTSPPVSGYREIHRTAPPYDIIPLFGRRGLLAGVDCVIYLFWQICQNCSAGIIVLRRHLPRLGGLGNGLL